jgi:signal transduction histidine kinase/ActR/RegA family two-component response regulator
MERSVASEKLRAKRYSNASSSLRGSLSKSQKRHSSLQDENELRQLLQNIQALEKGDFSVRLPTTSRGLISEIGVALNEIIQNFKDTTRKNKEQDWLKSNLARFASMMQGQRSITSVAQLIMSELTPLVDCQQGTFFLAETEGREVLLRLIASYAFTSENQTARTYRLKEGLIGQCAFDKKRIWIKQPEDFGLTIASSLVELRPRNIIVLPISFEGDLKAVIELASIQPFRDYHVNFLDQLADSIGVILNLIASSMRTEELLQELKRSNGELEMQAKELEEKAKLLEIKNNEIELASRSLEEKAEQLSMISKYKSEFLANMSHELRTPLNSLLILSKALADNKSKNLTDEQVKYALTVHSAGNDLLELINEILDLSKVESGKMLVSAHNFYIEDLIGYLEQTFKPVAESKNLGFQIKVSPDVPRIIFSDENRLQQILKNLLSNAFKFTDHGSVQMELSLEDSGNPQSMLMFVVRDSGIGIASNKQQLIFEAFQQADGTTSRKYGGTGLGLTISREIAHLLGGLIEVESKPGEGSLFCLFLPQTYTGADATMAELQSENEFEDLPSVEGSVFRGRKILIVDDDVRNIFALSSLLKSHGIEVFHAENGRQSLEVLDLHPEIEAILMDTMMPEMDGLEAIQKIRSKQCPQQRNLPIISLTAKAMKGDREKCLEAGASDYITKPVDERTLFAVLYKWLMEGTNAK